MKPTVGEFSPKQPNTMSAFTAFTATTAPTTVASDDDNGFKFHMEELSKKFPELYSLTIEENEIRKKIATGGASVIEGLINITPDMCVERVQKTPTLIPTLLEEYEKRINHHNIFTYKNSQAFSWDNETNTMLSKILQIPNVVAAGGFALNYICPDISCGDDIDIFIWGVSEEEALEKIRQIGNITGNFENRSDDDCSRRKWGFLSGHAITFDAPTIKVQVILRIYKSPAEILHGFDIPASKVLLVSNPDKKIETWATKSFITCMKYRTIWTDPERQSQTYIIRLYKYWSKGFDVLLVGLDRKKVNNILYTTRFQKLKGMARIVKSEQLIYDLFMDTWTKRPYFSFIKKILCDKTGLPASDYSDKKLDNYEFFTNKEYFEIALKSITWITQDPGTQTVIGSFHPENERFFEGLY